VKFLREKKNNRRRKFAHFKKESIQKVSVYLDFRKKIRNIKIIQLI
jgi:hypothetical protein